MKKRAYIDIETTGLSRTDDEITVIGIAIEDGHNSKVIQLVDSEISQEMITKSLIGIDEIYSYNGSRFDLPFIKNKTGAELSRWTKHTDLMYACLKQGYKGGLKNVEKQLNIGRRLTEVNGFEAIHLWWDYVNNNNNDSLQILLAYNAEDVINLIELRKKLSID